jgi:hypothetical protein
MGLWDGRAGRLTAQNGGFRRGQCALLDPIWKNGTGAPILPYFRPYFTIEKGY